MKGLFNRATRQNRPPSIRERYVLEILLPVSGKLLTHHFSYGEWDKCCAAYTEWASPRDRNTPAPILYIDVVRAR